MKKLLFFFFALLLGGSVIGQLSEGFETWPPADWTIVQGPCSPTNDITQSLTYANSGTYSARLSSFTSCGSGYDEYMITPQLNTTSGDQTISFWYRKYTSGSEVFTVGWSSTGTNVSTDFTWDTDVTDASTTWQQYSKTDLPVGTKYVAIHYHSTYAYYLYIDDVAGPALGGVTNPGSFMAVAASTSEIDLDWTQNGASDNVMVAWSSDGTFGTPVDGTAYAASDPITGGGTVIYNGSALHFDHTGLTGSQTYYYKAWSVNGSNNYSSGMTDDATTLCDATVFPFNEDFEADWMGTPQAPLCWSQITVSGTNEWERSSYLPQSGTYVAKAPWASGGGEHLLITPELDFGTDDYRIKFWLKGSSSTGTDLKVQIADNNSSEASFTVDLAEYIAGTNMPTTWTEYIIDLSAYENTQYIAFRMLDNNGYSLYIDNVTIEEIPVVPIFEINPVSVDYGPLVAGNSSATQEFTISNEGGGTLTITAGGITLAGTDPGQFTLTDGNAYPINLLALEEVTVEVAFSPTTSGAKTATLQVVHNAAGSPSSAALSGLAFAADALFESFEGDFPPAGWATDASSWTQSSTNYDGLKSAYNYDAAAVTDEKLITPKVTVSSGDQLVFFARNSYGTDESLQIRYSADKTTWTDVGTPIALTSTWTQYNVDLTSIAGSNYYLAFGANSAATYNYFYVDYVFGPPIFPELPGPAVIDEPEDAAIDVDISTTLSWTQPVTGGIPDEYKLYFGTDGAGASTPTNIENGTVSTSPYTPASVLAYSTTYYWQVVPSNSVGDATGCPIWSFTTAADPTLTPPVTQDFEGTFPPLNYTRYSGLLEAPSTLTPITYGWIQDDWRNVTSPVNKAARVNIFGTSCKYWLVTPPIDISAGGFQLEFDLTLNDYGTSDPPELGGDDDKFAVIISTDNGVTWTSANTLQLWDNDAGTTSSVYNDINPDGETIIIDLSTYSGTVKIGFYGESTVSNTDPTADNDLMIDNLKVRVPPLCLAPQSLTTTDETTSAATLNWNEMGTASLWDIVVGAPGFDPDAGPFAYTHTYSCGEPCNTTYPIPNATLASGTSYQWYIRADCGGSVSEWSTGAFFNTVCEVYTVPILEAFDLVTAPAVPNCWTGLVVSSSTYSSVETETFNYSAPNSLELYNSSDVSGDIILVSPEIAAATPISTLGVSFYYKGSTGYQLLIGTMTDPLDETTFTTYQTLDFTSSDWTLHEVYFNAYGDNDHYIAFKHGLGGSYRSINIDDIEIDVLPSCLKPSDLMHSDVTHNSAVLSWSEMNLPPATSWDIELDVTGFTPTETPTQAGVTNPYTYGGLLSETSYDYYVRTNCGGGDYSEWVGPHTFTTTQIPETVPVTLDFESGSIADWGVVNGTETNGWFVGMATASAPSTYSVYISDDAGTTNNYDNTAYSIVHIYRDIEFPAGINPVNLSFDWRADAESCCDYMRVYLVDPTVIPVDGSFLSSGQIGGNYNAEPTWTSASIDLDPGLQSTIKRLVITWKNDGSAGNQPPAAIDNISFTEISCPTPVDLVSSNFTTGSADIGWTEYGMPTEWEVEYGESPFTFTGVPSFATTANPHTITGLDPATSYDWKVRSSCGGGEFSDWTDMSSFVTACAPFTVPWMENFDGVSTPALPICTSVENTNGDAKTWITSSSSPASSPNHLSVSWNSDEPMNDWFFSPALDLTAGVNYVVEFKYTNNSTTFFEKLEVFWGTDATSVDMTNGPIFTDDNILYGGVYQDGLAYFTPPADGIYYVGWHGYSDTDQFSLYLDDVAVNTGVIDIQNPKVNTKWTQGEFYQILWTSNLPPAENLRIQLYKGGVFNSTLAFNTANDGEFIWTVPAGLADGCDYQIRMYQTADPSVVDLSVDFCLGDPYVEFINPIDGITWEQGEYYPLKWTSSAPSTDEVRIQLWNSEGLHSTLAFTTTNDGIFNWIVPNDASIADGCDYYFKIYLLSDPDEYGVSPIFCFGVPSINVVTPSQLASWTEDHYWYITWNSTIGAEEDVTIQLFKDGTYVAHLAFVTDNDGVFVWTIPVGVYDIACDYQIRINSNSTPTDFGISKLFCIDPPAAFQVDKASPADGSNSGNLEVNIFPNPVTDEVNIAVENLKGDDLQFFIYDGFGKQVWEKSYIDFNYRHTEQFQVSSLSDGMYMVVILNDGKIVHKKFIKH